MSDVPSNRPSLYEVIRLAQNTFSKRLRVAMPGRITAFDPVKVTVDVKPLLMQWEIDPNTESTTNISLPIVAQCPLIFAGSGGFRTTYPVEVGDTVLLIVADHSIEEWQVQGNERATEEVRTHDLTDAIAITGLRDLTDPWTGVSIDSMTLGADGAVQIEIRTDRINLVLKSVEQYVLGTTYRNNESQLNNTLMQQMTALNAAATALNVAMTALNVAMTTLATASVGPLAGLAPGHTAGAAAATSAATAATQAASAANAMAQAIQQMESNPTQYLSTTVYGT